MDTSTNAPFELAPLPWAQNALEPVISARTIALHYGKHHRAYVAKLNELVKGTRFADMPLEQVVAETAGRAETQKLFNQAGQAWNHAFFWRSLRPGGGGKPGGALARRIDSDLGGYDAFRDAFIKAAVECFGSGWAWLVERGGKLEVLATSNAGTPIATGATPLLTVDVWEHAYYLDYENRRPEFVTAIVDKLLDWRLAESHLEGGSSSPRKVA